MSIFTATLVNPDPVASRARPLFEVCKRRDKIKYEVLKINLKAKSLYVKETLLFNSSLIQLFQTPPLPEYPPVSVSSSGTQTSNQSRSRAGAWRTQ